MFLEFIWFLVVLCVVIRGVLSYFIFSIYWWGLIRFLLSLIYVVLGVLRILRLNKWLLC